MKKSLLIAVAILVSGGGVHAATVRSKTGATAHVADDAASRFQCLIDRLDGSGYPIKFMGGFGPRGNPSKHPSGHALDVNQFARNVMRPHIPSGATAYAEACGLFHGALWSGSPDAGHFEVPGPTPGSYARRHRGGHRHARRHRRPRR
jgi:hypothetical protein